ncbi:FAA hydrolase family protein, partial [Mesorhizobium sp. M2D.F.Ca.ET.145.01.1.1]
TPAGVGAVKPGETISGGVEGIGTIDVTIGQPRS